MLMPGLVRFHVQVLGAAYFAVNQNKTYINIQIKQRLSWRLFPREFFVF